MNLFQPGPFQPVLFQTGAAPSVARSGWFRLLLSELQEEALKEDAKKKDDGNTAAKKTQAVEKTVEVRRRKLRKEIAEEPREEAPPVRLKPMFRPVLIEAPSASPLARNSIEETDSWVREFARAAQDYNAMIGRLREKLELDVAETIKKRRRRKMKMLMLAVAT